MTTRYIQARVHIVVRLLGDSRTISTQRGLVQISETCYMRESSDNDPFHRCLHNELITQRFACMCVDCVCPRVRDRGLPIARMQQLTAVLRFVH